MTALFVLWSAPQDSACLLTRACIELKNKQTEVVNENSKNLNCEIDALGTRQETRAILGAVVDSMASEATSKKLENNEKNIKSIILGDE